MADRSTDIDKHIDIQHDEYAKGASHHEPLMDFDQRTEKKLIRRVDRRLLPMLGLLYSIALIDRTNISAARISGMAEDLRLDIGNRYTIALVVFFPPYALFELPSNIVLRKVGSARWLSSIALAWGIVMIGQVRHTQSNFTGEARVATDRRNRRASPRITLPSLDAASCSVSSSLA